MVGCAGPMIAGLAMCANLGCSAVYVSCSLCGMNSRI